jgi:phosphotriesterase-related protein
MNRREFLVGMMMPVERSVLVHEHVMVDFIGADQIGPGRYDPEEVFRTALPKLEEIRRLGCRRLLECTPNYLGRDPKLMKRLSDASGIEIWTNTGLYGAAEHKFVPAFARTESAKNLRGAGLPRRARAFRDSSRPE